MISFNLQKCWNAFHNESTIYSFNKLHCGLLWRLLENFLRGFSRIDEKGKLQVNDSSSMTKRLRYSLIKYTYNILTAFSYSSINL